MIKINQKKLTLDDYRGLIGRAVVYRNGPTMEQGIITSVNDQFVFARYGNDIYSKATDPRYLELVAHGV